VGAAPPPPVTSTPVSAATLDEHEGDVFGEHQFVDVLASW
jgi:hypothetical protein